jgi:hypothetical protein
MIILSSIRKEEKNERREEKIERSSPRFPEKKTVCVLTLILHREREKNETSLYSLFPHSLFSFLSAVSIFFSIYCASAHLAREIARLE